MAVAAAEAGKHVLCEKPMAIDVGECDRMIAAAEANGVKLGVAYYRRFYPILRRLKQLLDEGVIGAPVAAQADAFEAFDPGPDHPRRWIVEKGQAGDVVRLGCHRLEVLLTLFGQVADARGLTAQVALRRSVEDTAVALLRFEDGPWPRQRHTRARSRGHARRLGRTGSTTSRG
jgi:predicted dehydrogenase